VKPGGRVRLFYWLDRMLGRAELKRWLGTVPGLDFSTLNDLTPNYVAKPTFVGMPDPVPVRSGLVAGAVDAVAVPPLPEPERRASAPPTEPRPYAAPAREQNGFRATRSEQYMLGCLRALAGAPEGQGRDQCLRVAARLYGFAKAGLLDAADVTARIKATMRDHRGWRDGDPHGCTPAELDRILSWAWTRSEPKGLPR
jgi:hypothetical protein